MDDPVIKSSGCCMKVLEALYQTNKGPWNGDTGICLCSMCHLGHWFTTNICNILYQTEKNRSSCFRFYWHSASASHERIAWKDTIWLFSTKGTSARLNEIELFNLQCYILLVFALWCSMSVEDPNQKVHAVSRLCGAFLVNFNRCLQRRSRHSTRMWPSTGSSQPKHLGSDPANTNLYQRKKGCKGALFGFSVYFPSCSKVTWQSFFAFISRCWKVSLCRLSGHGNRRCDAARQRCRSARIGWPATSSSPRDVQLVCVWTSTGHTCFLPSHTQQLYNLYNYWYLNKFKYV